MFCNTQGGKVRYDHFSPKLRHLPFLAIDRAICQRNLRKVKKLGSFFRLNPGVICSKGTTTQDTCHVSTTKVAKLLVKESQSMDRKDKCGVLTVHDLGSNPLILVLAAHPIHSY